MWVHAPACVCPTRVEVVAPFSFSSSFLFSFQICLLWLPPRVSHSCCGGRYREMDESMTLSIYTHRTNNVKAFYEVAGLQRGSPLAGLSWRAVGCANLALFLSGFRCGFDCSHPAIRGHNLVPSSFSPHRERHSQLHWCLVLRFSPPFFFNLHFSLTFPLISFFFYSSLYSLRKPRISATSSRSPAERMLAVRIS